MLENLKALTVTFLFPQGMQYLHQSAVKSHGILCSRLCFLDARWVTKISGFGSISNTMFMEKNKKGADPEERFASKILFPFWYYFSCFARLFLFFCLNTKDKKVHMD